MTMTRQGGWDATGFGVRLKAIREEAGLSQSELAEKVGCHKFTISKLERGTQEPAWPLVLALCKALGLTCEAFTPAPGEQPPAAEPKMGRPRKAPASGKASGQKKKGKM
jgi:putative transcriptional regulator